MLKVLIIDKNFDLDNYIDLFESTKNIYEILNLSDFENFKGDNYHIINSKAKHKYNFVIIANDKDSLEHINDIKQDIILFSVGKKQKAKISMDVFAKVEKVFYGSREYKIEDEYFHKQIGISDSKITYKVLFNDFGNDKITFCIPCYKSEKVLKSCLESIKKQTIDQKFIEVNLLFDGKYDQSLYDKHLKKIIGSMTNINIKIQDNQGIVSARSKLIETTKTKYMSYVDADDTINIDFAKYALLNLINNPNAGVMIYGYERIFYKKISKIYLKQMDINIHKNSYKGKIIPKYVKTFSHAGWAKIYRTDIVNKLNYKSIDFRMGEDIIYTNTLFLSDEVIFCKAKMYNYLVSENSMTQSFDKSDLKIIRAYNEIYKLLRKKKMTSEFKEVINYREMYYVYIMLYSHVLKITDKEKFSQYLKVIDDYFYRKYGWNSLKNKFLNIYERIFLLIVLTKQFWLLRILLKR